MQVRTSSIERCLWVVIVSLAGLSDTIWLCGMVYVILGCCDSPWTT